MSFSVASAVDRIQRDNRRHEAECAQRLDRARREAHRLVEVLVGADPSIVRIWGFGSAFERGRPFGLDSDLDLALDGGVIHRLQSLVDNSEFSVELVDITGAEDLFAQQIRKQGRLLWGKP